MAAHQLEEYIQQLQAPVIEFRDPEDDTDETAARLAPHIEEDSTESFPQFSSLRRRAAAFNDVGGKKTSRKELYGDSSCSDEEHVQQGIASGEEEMDEEEERFDDGGSDGDDVESDEDDDEAEEEEDDEAEEGEGETLGSDYDEADEDGDEGVEVKQNGDADGDLQESEEDSAEGGDDASDEEITSEESEAEEVIQKTAIDEGEKAQAVVQQLDLWDRLMEARIQLQKVLSMANRLPSGSLSQPEEQASPLRDEAGDVLLEMNCTLYDVHNKPSSPKKRKADVDVEELAQESYQSLVEARNTTLTFWDEKTRLASKKFKSFKSYQTPVVKQVEQILSDRDRLLRRTQVIRDSEAPDVCEKPEEVFDDNDFYQRLLKNLIESKATEETALSSSASQWVEVQRLRGNKKKKRDVDTRASKGRKLRYNVHTKLVNFMAPRDDAMWSEDARNELFKNLFKMPSQSEM